MRPAFAFALLCACGGPSTDQLVETPSATVREPETEAPSASTSDADRRELIRQFDDMRITQQAYEEAEGEGERTPPAPPGKAAPPKKKGPAEQGTLPKKKGPAEQAPRQSE